MTQFTTVQVEEVERVLGYSVINTTVRSRLVSDYTDTIIDRALTILDELVNIDNLLKESLGTSFVLESRGSKLNYRSHVAHLKSEGTRLLNELGQVLIVGVNFDKYSSNSQVKSLAYW